MLSQHANAKLDMLSQHAKHGQAIPACLAKVIVYKGLLEPRAADKLWESEETNNTTTSQEARQGKRCKA